MTEDKATVNINIHRGNNQILPNATHAEQHIHYHAADIGGAVSHCTQADTACRNLCNTLQLSINRYTTLTVQGHTARKYDNRITVVGADLNEIDFSPWLV